MYIKYYFMKNIYVIYILINVCTFCGQNYINPFLYYIHIYIPVITFFPRKYRGILGTQVFCVQPIGLYVLPIYIVNFSHFDGGIYIVFVCCT